ncbi:MAG TPA: hypothetical protein P5048_04260 [Chlamydiales bacterium]|nr:hypothetical protein [Chlamydiales bacterium]
MHLTDTFVISPYKKYQEYLFENKISEDFFKTKVIPRVIVATTAIFALIDATTNLLLAGYFSLKKAILPLSLKSAYHSTLIQFYHHQSFHYLKVATFKSYACLKNPDIVAGFHSVDLPPKRLEIATTWAKAPKKVQELWQCKNSPKMFEKLWKTSSLFHQNTFLACLQEDTSHEKEEFINNSEFVEIIYKKTSMEAGFNPFDFRNRYFISCSLKDFRQMINNDKFSKVIATNIPLLDEMDCLIVFNPLIERSEAIKTVSIDENKNVSILFKKELPLLPQAIERIYIESSFFQGDHFPYDHLDILKKLNQLDISTRNLDCLSTEATDRIRDGFDHNGYIPSEAPVEYI